MTQTLQQPEMLQQKDWSKLDKKRWLALIGGLLVMVTISYSYTWSLMVNPMIEERGATLASMALLYSILNIGYSFLMLVGGKLVDMLGSRKMIIVSVIFYAIGFGMCGMWRTFAGFTIGTLVFINMQNGFGYMAVYANIQKLFPDRKGLCMSLVGMGTTGGGMIMSPMCQGFIDKIGFSNQFLAMGAILTVLGILAIAMWVTAPDDYVPTGYSYEEAEKEAAAAEAELAKNENFVQKDWKLMLRDPAFYLLFLGIIFASVGSMILMFQMSWVAQDIIKCTPGQAAFLVSGVTGANALGKLTWGAISDKFGRLNLWPIILLLMALSYVIMAFLSEGMAIVFIVFSLLATFCAGGHTAFTGPLTSDMFGSKNFGFNFSIVLIAPTVATVISPWLAAAGLGAFVMFGVCALCAVGAAVCAIIIRKLKKDNLEVLHKI